MSLAGLPSLSPRQDACVIFCCSPGPFEPDFSRKGMGGGGAERLCLEVPFLQGVGFGWRGLPTAAVDMGSSLSPGVLEAWAQSAAQGRVQQAVIAQFQWTGVRCPLRTCWAQRQTASLSMQLEPQVEAQEASPALPRSRVHLRHQPRLANRAVHSSAQKSSMAGPRECDICHPTA